MTMSDEELDRALEQARGIGKRLLLPVYLKDDFMYWFRIGQALGALVQDLRFRFGQEVAGLNELASLLDLITTHLGQGHSLASGIQSGSQGVAKQHRTQLESLQISNGTNTPAPPPLVPGRAAASGLVHQWAGLHETLAPAVRAPP